MGIISRPVFQEGERLTALRLNRAFEFLRESVRRTLLGALSPGVALGLTMEARGDSVLVKPGIAIERRGRLVVVPDPLLITAATVQDAVGSLEQGDRVRVGIGLGTASSPADPCANGHEVREEPKLFFRKLSGSQASSGVGFADACVDPWGDLDASSADLDGCSVELGVLELGSEAPFAVDLRSRQGIAPRFDVLRNSYDEVVAELRTREGNARAYFVAPAGGPNVQATHIAKSIDDVPAATYSRGSPHVLELAGGTGRTVEAGKGGVLGIPLVTPVDTPIEAGTVLELVPDSTDIPQVRPITEPNNVFGIAVGASYWNGQRVVPVGVAGLVEMPVVDITEFGSPAGTPLTPRDAYSLRPAQQGDRVVAILGVRVWSSTAAAPVFVVHPTYVRPAGSS